MACGWGLVGTGVIASHFAGDIKFARRAHLAGVASRALSRAQEFANAHGTRAFDHFEAMLGDPSVDAIYIATPTATHFVFAEAALKAGKPVLVEKPLAGTSAEASQLAALAATNGVFAMEAMWTRFLPALAFVRQTLQSGALGEVIRVKGELAFLKPFTADSRFFDRAQGGGALLDLGCYGISLCLALFGKPDRIDGSWVEAATGVDLRARTDLRFGNVEATLACGFDRTGANLFSIEGRQGKLVLQPPFNAVRMVIDGAPGQLIDLVSSPETNVVARGARKLARTIPLPGLSRHQFDFEGHGLHFEMDAVADMLTAGSLEHPLSPLADSIETLRIIEQLLALPPSRL